MNNMHTLLTFHLKTNRSVLTWNELSLMYLCISLQSECNCVLPVILPFFFSEKRDKDFPLWFSAQPPRKAWPSGRDRGGRGYSRQPIRALLAHPARGPFPPHLSFYYFIVFKNFSKTNFIQEEINLNEKHLQRGSFLF